MQRTLGHRASNRHNRGSCRISGLVFAFSCFVSAHALDAQSREAVSRPTPGTESNENTISNFEDLWRWNSDDAAHPINMELVVTYHDPEWGNLWGMVGGAPGYLHTLTPLPVRSGDRIHLVGSMVPAQGLSAPELEITILERDVDLEPIDANGRLSERAQFEERYITIDVTVESESIIDDHHLSLAAVCEDQRLQIYSRADAAGLLGIEPGARARLRGVYLSNDDASAGGFDATFQAARVELLDRRSSEPLPHNAAPVAPPIRTFSDFWTAQDKTRPHPIEMDLLVAYYDPTWDLLWGECDGSYGFLQCEPGSSLPFRSRDRVSISGSIVPRTGLAAQSARIEILEPGVHIEPLIPNGDLTNLDKYAARVISAEMILDNELVGDPHHFQMQGTVDGIRTKVFLWQEHASARNYNPGSIIRVTGLYNKKHDPRLDIHEIDLWVARPQDIELVGHLGSDARFTLPLKSIAGIPPTIENDSNPVRIIGAVREYNRGHEISLRDETGQIIVRTVQHLPLKIGDVVEAAGIPNYQGSEPTLEKGIVRIASSDSANSLMLRINSTRELRMAEDVLALGHAEAAAGRPVKLRGIVTWRSEREKILVLSDATGGVVLDLSEIAGPFPKLEFALEIEGKSALGRFAPAVKVTAVEYLIPSLIPRETKVVLDQTVHDHSDDNTFSGA